VLLASRPNARPPIRVNFFMLELPLFYLRCGGKTVEGRR